VKVFGIAILALILLVFVIVLFGAGNHGPGRHGSASGTFASSGGLTLALSGDSGDVYRLDAAGVLGRLPSIKEISR
jgi:hypothetical protein